MKFFSTRDHSRIVTASQAIAQGLSDEGGLFVPESFPQVDVEALCQLDYPELAAAVVSEYLTDYSKDFLAEAARTTYGEAFGGKAGHLAPVEGDTAGELHREVLHVQHAPGSLPADGESIGQDIVQRFTVGQPLLQRGGLGLQLGIGHGLILRLQRQNFFHDRVDLFQLFVRKSTEESFSKGHW